ncbi:MAG: lipopolysaccharide heptosyltransferase II [Gemmatimonadota bacterium]
MKILIVGPAWVGDMVMAHTLVQTLVARHEDPEIVMLAPPASQPIAARMPEVAESIPLDVRHGRLDWGVRRRMAKEMKSRRFEVAFVLPNSFKSALIPFWARVPRRVGWHGESRYGILNDRRMAPERHALMIERYMALAWPPAADLPRPYPRPRLLVDEVNRETLRDRLKLASDGPVTILCPGSEYGPAKRWPPRHYATLARALLDSGQHVWLVGSPRDAVVCAEIQAQASGVVDLSGRTSLLDAVDVLSLAEVVVSNDSGLMHVACALDRRVVALFGSTSPDYTPPLSDRATVLKKDLECSPCFQRQCPLGHTDCLVTLEPEQVIAVL